MPSFFICVIILSSLSFGVLFSSSDKLNFPSVLNALLSFSLFFLLTLVILFGNDFCTTSSALYFFNQHFQALFLLLSFLVILATRDFVDARNIARFEYDILLLFVLFSSLCLCFANDLFLLYLAIELQSLSFYVFATINRRSEFSTESGLKYFVLGAIISCVLLLGFSMIYIAFGSTSFEFLTNLTQVSINPFFFLGTLFVLIAFLFKVGGVPFHIWLCDVYDGAMTSVTLLFASAPKIILFSLLIKLFLIVFFDFSAV